MKKGLLLLGAVLVLRAAWGALQQQSPNENLLILTGSGTFSPFDDPALDDYDDPLPHHPSPPRENKQYDEFNDPSTYKDPSHPSSHHEEQNQWAIVYFPYTSSATCKTPLTVRSDINSIHAHGFTSIRLHASDCNALYTVGSACSLHNMKIILGIHMEDGLSPDLDPLALAEEQISDLISWAADPTSAGWSIIELVVVGEETVFSGLLTPSALASFITSTRTRLRIAGYTGPVTTTEPIPALYQHAALLCPAIDIAASNIHPFFSSAVTAKGAGAYVRDALDVLDQICPDKPPGLNLETGWPTRGSVNGEAVPGMWEQALAVRGIMEHAGYRSTVIGWGDDQWKDEGELGVEGAWGCERLFAPSQQGGTVEAEEDTLKSLPKKVLNEEELNRET